MDPSTRSLLVVDDERHNLRFIGRVLMGQGYQVHVADSGELALETARAVAPDLVLLDVRMPHGLDGLETCRRLKANERTRHVPVIFLTGRDDEETMIRAFDAGGADYVLKPFDARVLLARVKTHLELGLLSRSLERALAERSRELSEANDRLRRLAMEVPLIEERERKRVAAELHDSPMQKLALAQVHVAAVARHPGEEWKERLETGLDLIREALQELRSLQFELSPPLLHQHGLAAALEWLAAHASRSFGVKVSFSGSGQLPALRGDLAVVLFQCARELVYNLAKYAEASEGRIELGFREGALVLSVSDDGRGMPSDAARREARPDGGYGLFSVRERMALLGGGLTIESDRTGTRASVWVPDPTGAGAIPLATGREPGGPRR
jgi:signal transduction histidine kinase